MSFSSSTLVSPVDSDENIIREAIKQLGNNAKTGKFGKSKDSVARVLKEKKYEENSLIEKIENNKTLKQKEIIQLMFFLFDKLPPEKYSLSENNLARFKKIHQQFLPVLILMEASCPPKRLPEFAKDLREQFDQVVIQKQKGKVDATNDLVIQFLLEQLEFPFNPLHFKKGKTQGSNSQIVHKLFASNTQQYPKSDAALIDEAHQEIRRLNYLKIQLVMALGEEEEYFGLPNIRRFVPPETIHVNLKELILAIYESSTLDLPKLLRSPMALQIKAQCALDFKMICANLSLPKSIQLSHEIITQLTFDVIRYQERLTAFQEMRDLESVERRKDQLSGREINNKMKKFILELYEIETEAAFQSYLILEENMHLWQVLLKQDPPQKSVTLEQHSPADEKQSFATPGFRA
jgi:hypothetical protein